MEYMYKKKNSILMHKKNIILYKYFFWLKLKDKQRLLNFKVWKTVF